VGYFYFPQSTSPPKSHFDCCDCCLCRCLVIRSSSTPSSSHEQHFKLYARRAPLVYYGVREHLATSRHRSMLKGKMLKHVTTGIPVDRRKPPTAMHKRSIHNHCLRLWRGAARCGTTRCGLVQPSRRERRRLLLASGGYLVVFAFSVFEILYQVRQAIASAAP